MSVSRVRMKRLLTSVIGALATMAILTGVAVANHTPPPDVDAWLREVQVGPYQPADIDWDEVYELARAEGKVVVYTSSSRTIRSKEEFEALYPGVELEVHHLGTTGSIERLQREQRAGLYHADVLFASAFPVQLNLLHEQNMVFPFYPPELVNAIPSQFRDPLVAHTMEVRGAFYNSAVYDEPPISSWWDLTKPEWHGRVLMVDPIVDGSTMDMVTTLVLMADDLAADYERVFGHPIELTEPNAGYQLLKGILDNGVRRFPGHREVGDVVGDTSLEDPPVGLGMVYSQIRYYLDPGRGFLEHLPLVDLQPKAGMLYPTLMNIPYRAPNPNAAKLFIRYMFGDEDGGLGYTHFSGVGEWTAREMPNVRPTHPDLGVVEYPTDRFWYMDPVGLYEIQLEVQDWWLINAQ
jgi:iron(III) transport system substrate-binding protein